MKTLKILFLTMMFAGLLISCGGGGEEPTEEPTTEEPTPEPEPTPDPEPTPEPATDTTAAPENGGHEGHDHGDGEHEH